MFQNPLYDRIAYKEFRRATVSPQRNRSNSFPERSNSVAFANNTREGNNSGENYDRSQWITNDNNKADLVYVKPINLKKIYPNPQGFNNSDLFNNIQPSSSKPNSQNSPLLKLRVVPSGGRGTADCGPCSIAVVSGVPYLKAITVAAKHGYRPGRGITFSEINNALNELNVNSFYHKGKFDWKDLSNIQSDMAIISVLGPKNNHHAVVFVRERDNDNKVIREVIYDSRKSLPRETKHYTLSGKECIIEIQRQKQAIASSIESNHGVNESIACIGKLGNLNFEDAQNLAVEYGLESNEEINIKQVKKTLKNSLHIKSDHHYGRPFELSELPDAALFVVNEPNGSGSHPVIFKRRNSGMPIIYDPGIKEAKACNVTDYQPREKDGYLELLA